MQQSEWSMISNNSCTLAINMSSTLLDCNNIGQVFLLMSCIVVGCTHQLFAIVCNGLESITLILRQTTTKSHIRCISFNDKITSHISNQPQRCRGQCSFQSFKCPLLRGNPKALNMEAQQNSERCTYGCIVWEKPLIEICASQERTQV